MFSNMRDHVSWGFDQHCSELFWGDPRILYFAPFSTKFLFSFRNNNNKVDSRTLLATMVPCYPLKELTNALKKLFKVLISYPTTMLLLPRVPLVLGLVVLLQFVFENYSSESLANLWLHLPLVAFVGYLEWCLLAPWNSKRPP